MRCHYNENHKRQPRRARRRGLRSTESQTDPQLLVDAILAQQAQTTPFLVELEEESDKPGSQAWTGIADAMLKLHLTE